MRMQRKAYIPMIRLYDHERAELEDQAGENGYSVTDWVRQTFGFETEHPPKKLARPAKLARK